jgi:hypothetical protein
MTRRPRTFRLHYYKDKNCWTVVLSDATYHAKRITVTVPLEGVLQQGHPRAYLTGKGYVRQLDEHTVEIT